jgi:hypothetical protein
MPTGAAMERARCGAREDLPRSRQCELPLEAGIQARFEAFHRDNPDVFRQLVRIAKEMKRRGMRCSSLDYLLHILRWNTFRRTGKDGFKLNDHFTSRYARLIEDTVPELRGFFHTRGLRSN